jgi:cytochrome c biogenesis protein CcdA/thiol-disulfide isomerase/thioredoxin
MILLLLIGFLGGVVTAISPCVLPVLPILLAGGASGRNPVRVIGGLVASFSFFTLFATWILDKLGLPQDLLRNLAIVFLFLLAATLLVPRVALIVERPLYRFSRVRARGGSFVFGAMLGLVFVPCAGPVLATVTVVAANDDVGVRAILLTLAYAAGAAVPMLAIAYGGRGAAQRLRAHAHTVRVASGAVVAVVALGLVFHVDDRLATLTPGYTSFLQTKIEDSASAKRELAKVRGGGDALAATHPTKVGGLPDYGVAPPLQAGGEWINTKPLTLDQLRGKVVLVDFWTYSCINCLRTLPHLRSWYSTYHPKGLVIVGVHTPEFAFEHVASNVRAAVKRLGIAYPVVQDNHYKTWDNYANQYWPAEYLIDKTGHVRHTHFGEGEYDQTESLIRRLLGADGLQARHVADATPSGMMTPESYLGYARLTNYVGRNPLPDQFAQYRFPGNLTANTLAYDGRWKVGAQAITAGANAKLRLHFEASNIYIVMGGHGTVHAFVDGKPAGTIHVDAQRLYTVRAAKYADALLELRFSPGVQAYSFTFG